MEYENILYEKEGPIATITFNRPDTVNAISPDLEKELHIALDHADEDSEVRVIVLTGSGRAFSAGYDLAGDELSFESTGKYPGEYLKGWWHENMGVSGNVQKLMHLWYLSKPVIAAINGWCMGGGFWYPWPAILPLHPIRRSSLSPKSAIPTTPLSFSRPWRDGRRRTATP